MRSTETLPANATLATTNGSRPILEAMQGSSRVHFPQFDFLRGAAIVAVVYLHAYFTAWPEVSQHGLTAVRGAHLVAHGAVPLFFLISAFLQAQGGRETVSEHLRRRWWSTWFPALLWMLAALAYRMLNDGASWTLARDLALFNISGQFYFVWLLLLFGVGLTQAWRVPPARWPLVVAAAFLLNLGTVIFYELNGGLGGLDGTVAYRNPLAWVFFPVFGAWLGQRGRDAMPLRVVVPALAVMAAAAVTYFVQGLQFNHWPNAYFGVSVFAFSAAAMCVYPALAKGIVLAGAGAPFVALSRYAFAIFLVHLPFVMGFGTRELLGDGATWSNYWLLLHANAIVGLVVSLALVRELDKASPRLGALIFGIRRQRNAGSSRPGKPMAHAGPTVFQ